MIIVGFEEFLQYPEGTIFSEYYPEFTEFDDLCIKGRNVKEIAFYFVPISSSIEFHNTEQLLTDLEKADRKGKRLRIDLGCTVKDCEFNKDRRFAMWELEELKSLQNKLAIACEFAEV
ncbi:UNVERIFIED_CONTAM: hypothetical protein BEN50_14395 [Euhalothece sp. KZN 001]